MGIRNSMCRHEPKVDLALRIHMHALFSIQQVKGTIPGAIPAYLLRALSEFLVSLFVFYDRRHATLCMSRAAD